MTAPVNAETARFSLVHFADRKGDVVELNGLLVRGSIIWRCRRPDAFLHRDQTLILVSVTGQLKRNSIRILQYGQNRGGRILRFPGGRESDSFWECRPLQTLTAFPTLS
jgi:hypothetical protein